jgi:hypothetical protein
MEVLTLEEWFAKAVKLYGSDKKNWKFKCPNCGQTQSLNDFLENSVSKPDEKFYFSCIGRWVKDRGCDWTLGGLLKIHSVEVISKEGKKVPVFEFAD